MSLIYSLLGITIFIYSIFLLLSYLTSGKLIFEITSYFLPYWLTVNLSLIFIIFLLHLEFKDLFRIKIFTFSLIFLSLITIVLTIKFFNFTYLKLPKAVANSSQKEIKVAAFNKLYSNTNYNQINEKLLAVNPDIIGLTELKKEDIVNIKALKNYQYSYFKNTRDGATISIFSKFPITKDKEIVNLPHVLPLTMKLDGNEYKVFVIHPMPPINPEWLKGRNDELNSLVEHINSLKTKDIILLGDFNLPPWSNTYSSLEKKLSNLKNASKGEGIHFTWHNSFIKTQVDHIFVPSRATVNQFNSERVEGSDHNLIWTNLSI